MDKRRVPALLMWGSITAVILLGIVLSQRFGGSSGGVRIHVEGIKRDSVALHCRWRIVGNRDWILLSSRTGPGPSSRIMLGQESALWNMLGNEWGSNTIFYDLTISRGPNNSGTQSSYSETIQWVGSHGSPISSATTAFSRETTAIDSLVKVQVTKDTEIHIPGRAVLATVDGNPVELEFPR